VTNTLYNFPPGTRKAIEEATQEGHPPWGLLNSARFREGISIRKLEGAQAGSFYGLATNSLDNIPADARFLAISGRAPAFRNLPDFRELEVLQVYDRVTEKEIGILAKAKSLRMLSLYNVQTDNADPLGGLANLEHVHLDTAPKLNRFQFLRTLKELRTVWLEHLRSLHELSEIGSLNQLSGLVLAGSMWTAMRLRTLQPLTALAGLRQLALVNVRVDDGSLTPLTRLTNLRGLRIPNWFSVAEFASLAAFLPSTAGSFHSPWFVEPKQVEEASYSTCKRCGRYSLGMTLGKPSKRLCPNCDAAKVQKVVANWETLLAAVKPHGASGETEV
jgi:hypothetical protein